MSDTLTLRTRECAYYPAAERDRDHTSYTISETALAFADRHEATMYLVWELGLSPERATTVIDRRCQFQTDEADPRPLHFTIYQIERDGRLL